MNGAGYQEKGSQKAIQLSQCHSKTKNLLKK